MFVDEQFLRVAEELGWDINSQIAKLEEFAELFGMSARLDMHLERRGVTGSARRDLKLVRNVYLEFVESMGNRGAMNHFLRNEMRLAAEAARAAEQAARETPAVPQAPAHHGWFARLRRRMQARA
ncbi:hypothetical protein KBTX_00169 [wastewater metagenome]|uniref:Uncharacterized protein n=2 Tax=unclassified sequences TaxID=12908 RepID=A0A5B8R538_9ZZZZ|nr:MULTISPECIES: hypothetical protein [Arhodomonas]MCS4502650.1 hypothetical protein [Arhodomonas aquaeolei]QEA03869.1 hypothetical protein KBTEX_00169 [uncultured organism]